MNHPFRFLLGFAVLFISRSLALPVLNFSTIYSFTDDASIGAASQYSDFSGGTVSAATNLGTVSDYTQGTVASSVNSLAMNYAFSEHLDAPHPNSDSSSDMNAESLANGTFTLDASDVGYTYSLTASFDQTGTSQMTLLASLYDITEYAALYDDYQLNNPSTDGSMGLGTGAQYFNYPTVGSTSGDLTAGHTYRYFFGSLLRHSQAAAGETVSGGQGTFALNIQGPAPEAVPEPASLVLAGLGLGGLLWVFRKRSVRC